MGRKGIAIMLDERKEEAFCTILREELQLATGCTEPIAVAYCAARLRQVLGQRPRRILAEVRAWWPGIRRPGSRSSPM